MTTHLIAEHDWPSDTPVNADHTYVHRFAHGGGSPDLADSHLTHVHVDRGRGPGEWGTSGPATGRKTSKGAWLLAVIAILVIGGIVSASNGGSGGSVGSSSSSMHTVTYKVEGSASGADLTMSTANGGTSQASGKAVPLRNVTTGEEGISFTARRGTFLYLSAQNIGESGTITCIIEVDGVPLVRNTSSGAYTIATCDSRL